jgi:hypothetical protein
VLTKPRQSAGPDPDASPGWLQMPLRNTPMVWVNGHALCASCDNFLPALQVRVILPPASGPQSCLEQSWPCCR